MSTQNRNILFFGGVSTVLLIFVAATAILFFPKQEPIQNVKIFVSNDSANDEPVSCRIKIGDSVVFANNNLKIHSDSIRLDPGSHIVEVGTIDGKYITTDTLTISGDKMMYLSIRYKYVPPYKEYLKIYKENYVKQIMLRRKYDEKQRASVAEQVDGLITKDYLKERNIVPILRNFEIEIRDFQYTISML